MYTQYYSNSRHDGFVNVNLNCKGELNWIKEFSGYAEKHLENRLLLLNNDHLIVDNMSEILCLDLKGNLVWKREKWYGSQVIIRNDLIYYTAASRKDRMEAVTFDNKLIIENFIIYGIIDESFLVLFEPYKDELIAQVQYPGIMEMSSDKFIIYKTGVKIPGYEWSRIFDEDTSPLIPLVNFEKGFILTATSSEVMLFDIKSDKEDAEPKISFPIPSKSGNVFVSSSEEGDLFFAYPEEDNIYLKCFSENGKEVYSVTVQEEFSNVNKVIAPPILANDYIYILTNNKLICISDKKVLWETGSEGLPFSYAAGLADNSVLVTQGNLIKNFGSDGKRKFMYEIKDKITAPVVADKNGLLYFCTKTKIYSLK